MIHCGERLPNWLQRSGCVDSGFQQYENAVPIRSIFCSHAIHAEWQEDVGNGPLFRSSEIARPNADDFKNLVIDVKGTAKHVRISAEPVVPIISRQNSILGRAGAIVGRVEQ